MGGQQGWCRALPSGVGARVEKGKVWVPSQVRRGHQLLHPQALDDANKGIIEELKKTDYREMLRERRERGEHPEVAAGFLPVLPSSASNPGLGFWLQGALRPQPAPGSEGGPAHLGLVSKSTLTALRGHSGISPVSSSDIH